MNPSKPDDCPYQSRYIDVLGSRMHYVEHGTGDPGLHYIQEDRPREIGKAIAEWMGRHGL